MFSVTDTIAAIATPPGRGGIGIVRLSGPDAHAIARRLIDREPPLEPRHATLAKVRLDESPDGSVSGVALISTTIDHAIVTFFPTPHSYTGDDVVEVSAPGRAR